MNDQVREMDWEYCCKILPKVSRTFVLNIAQLEGDIFKTVLLGYLLFRIADTFEDTMYQDEKEKITNLKDFSTVFMVRYEALSDRRGKSSRVSGAHRT